MNRPQILVLADMSAAGQALRLLQTAGDVVQMPPDPMAVAARIADFDAVMASLHMRLDEAILAQAARLRAIATPSTGRDHIDLDAAKQRGIRVLSLKDERAFLDRITATAELAWGLLLACVRKIPAGFAAAQQGHWARDTYRGMQLCEKTLGVLGYGRLGTMVAEYGRAFRMRVLACDVRPVSPAPGVTMVDFKTLLRESDVISIHVHLDDTTQGLLDGAAFRRMKPGAVIVNTSRGAVIDEAALLAALEQGQVAAAGLDVIGGEWRPDLADHPLIRYAREHDNLVITPHLGGVTWDSQRLAYEYTAKLLIGFLNQNNP